MITLDTLLSELFENKTASQLFKQLDSIGVTNYLRKAIIQINELIDKQSELVNETGSIPIGSLVANLLSSINNQLRNNSNVDKKEAEYLLSEIIRKLIIEMASHFKNAQKTVGFQLDFAIQKTCQFYDYDFLQLMKYLKIDELRRSMQLERGAIKLSSSHIPSLTWNLKNNPLQDFITLLYDFGLLKKRKGFNELFSNPKKRLDIIMNDEKAEEILLTFAYLKRKKAISFSGCKSIYEALKYHILYFEEKFLLSKSPQNRLNTIKNSKSKYCKKQALIELWLSELKL